MEKLELRGKRDENRTLVNNNSKVPINQDELPFQDNRQQASFNKEIQLMINKDSRQKGFDLNFHQYPSQMKASGLRYMSPIQRKLIVGPSEITDISQLSSVVKDKGFFNCCAKIWEKRLGKGHKTKNEKDAYMQRCYDALIALIQDPNYEDKIGSTTQLSEAVHNYMRFKAAEQDRERATEAMFRGGSLPAYVEKGSEDYPPLGRRLLQDILKTGRAFPEEAIRSLAAKSDAPGFLYELQLGLSALEQIPDAYVQFGIAPLKVIASYPFKIDEYTEKPRGLVGADIVVWMPKENIADSVDDTPASSATDKIYGADFVQAKACLFKNVEDEIDKARNQLEGQNAHPGRMHTASDGEYRLRGSGYIGSIFIKLLTPVEDINRVKRAATKALRSAFVDFVLVHDEIGHHMYIYPRDL